MSDGIKRTKRNWSDFEKIAFLIEAEKSSIASVSRKYGISENILFTWKRKRAQWDQVLAQITQASQKAM
jgi:transposase-like protein